MSEVTGVLSERAGSGAHARATKGERVVSTIDYVYLHNLPSTGLDEGMNDGKERVLLLWQSIRAPWISPKNSPECIQARVFFPMIYLSH